MVEKLQSAIKPVLICNPAAVATAGGRPPLSVVAVTLMIGREFQTFSELNFPRFIGVHAGAAIAAWSTASSKTVKSLNNGNKALTVMSPSHTRNYSNTSDINTRKSWSDLSIYIQVDLFFWLILFYSFWVKLYEKHLGPFRYNNVWKMVDFRKIEAKRLQENA